MPGKFFEADCRYCGEPIIFYSKILTKEGEWQALDRDTYRDHYCPRRRSQRD